MFKFTLTIATSAFLLMSGMTDLFAMALLDDGDGKPGKQLVLAKTEEAEPGPINHMPKDRMTVIFMEASKDTNPRRLTSVCKPWYSIMREDNIPQGAELHYSPTNILHSTMNPFMQQCMNTFWEYQFYNGILRYMPTDDGQSVTLKFADLNKEGTFDLSACGNTGQNLVITKSMDRFFKIEGENKDKAMILVTPRSLVEQRINTSPSHPLAARMADWDADKAPVGIFWRWGNFNTLVDYLTHASISKISSMNLYENWSVGLEARSWTVFGSVEMCKDFHVYF